jgi:hypothetical protein
MAEQKSKTTPLEEDSLCKKKKKHKCQSTQDNLYGPEEITIPNYEEYIVI